MKFILLLSSLIALGPSPSWACSELGAQDFEVSAVAQKSCGKIAVQYASQFAKQMVSTEKKEKSYAGPKGDFKLSEGAPKFYLAQKRQGNSKLIGFNVGLDSSNRFECNFCVDMTWDDQGNCKIESVRKHMCAN